MQVSRWTQYHLQVQKTCNLIYRREMLLLDLRDHVLLAGTHARSSSLPPHCPPTLPALEHTHTHTHTQAARATTRSRQNSRIFSRFHMRRFNMRLPSRRAIRAPPVTTVACCRCTCVRRLLVADECVHIQCVHVHVIHICIYICMCMCICIYTYTYEFAYIILTWIYAPVTTVAGCRTTSPRCERTWWR